MKLFGILFLIYSDLVLFCDLTIPAPIFHTPQTDRSGVQYIVAENVLIANVTVVHGLFSYNPNFPPIFGVDINMTLLFHNTGLDNKICHLGWFNTTFREFVANTPYPLSKNITVAIGDASINASSGWDGIINATASSGIGLGLVDDHGDDVYLNLRIPAKFITFGGSGYLEFTTMSNCSESTSVYYVAVGTTRGFKATFVHQMQEHEKDLETTCRSEVDSNGIQWTRAHQSSRVILSNACPSNYTGTVWRLCNVTALWQPSVFNCTATTLTHLQDELKTGSSNVSWTLNELKSFIEETNATSQELLVGDIEKTTEILKAVVNTLNVPDDTVGHKEITDFLTAAGHLMAENTKPSWRIILQESGSGIDTLLIDIERFFDLVATTRNESTYQQEYTAPNLYVKTGRILDQEINVAFPERTQASSLAMTEDSVNSIVMPVDKDMLGLSYTGILYDDLRDRLSQRFKDRDEATFLNSPIMAMTLTPRLRKPLSSPVTLTFKLFERSPFQPRCSFWKQGSTGGWWDTEGCTLDSYKVEDLIVVCKCTHLTNFAILMSQVPASPKHEKVLGIISLTGCIISMLCLVLTFAIYICNWRHVRSERAILLLNLCVCLFLAYLGFLLGVGRVADKNACTAIAAILQFLYLTVFFTMLAKSAYLAKICLLPTNKTPIVNWCLVAVYGTAAAVVGISLGVTKLHGYGTDTTCWLSIESGLLWAFAGPALFVMLVNAVIAVIVMRVKFTTIYMANKRTMEKISSGLRNILVLLPIMGITWVFGVFSVNEDTVVFQYLFAVCNSLQGMIVFVFHCLLDHKVKLALTRALKRKLRKAQAEAVYSANKKASVETSGSQDSSQAHVTPSTTDTT